MNKLIKWSKMAATAEEEEAEARNEENRFEYRNNLEEKIMQEREFDGAKPLPIEPKA